MTNAKETRSVELVVTGDHHMEPEHIIFRQENVLRAVCSKDQLRSCKIEKTDFPKLCQNKGLSELVLKI